MSDKINLTVIGAGPGGYAAAFLAADLGMNVTLVDVEENPGGVCLYRGCIPSKALLHIAKLIGEASESKNWGVEFSEPKINLDKLREWKDKVVAKNTGGLGILTKSRKINYIQGKASFVSSSNISVEKVDVGKEDLTFNKAIIATGSRISTIPSLNIESERFLNSKTALDLPAIPKSLLVIGGGYIGLEIGTVYQALGSKVSVVEMLDGLLPGADRDLVSHLSKKLKSKFDEIMLNSKVVELNEVKNGIKVKIEDKDGNTVDKTFDYVLMSVGRKPDTISLGLENTKVKVNDRGWIKVNEQLKTDDDNIYAIGDIVGEPMLAHKASHEGRTVVFTDPEIAWAGLTDSQAKENSINVNISKFPWAASGRAATLDRTDGVTKILSEPDTDRILGVGICGPGAGELIAEGALAIEMAANLTDLKLTIHPHPTLSETVMEAAEVFFGQSTHFYKPKRK
jgi:dihydrolipoamide dehydrogenase